MRRVREQLDHDTMSTVRTEGTAAYLEVCYRYVDICYSTTAPLLERCQNASYVINFLRLWRLFVFHHR